jgi:hypothetical protein
MRPDQKHGPDIVEADQTGKAGKANGQGPPGSRAAPKETGAEGAVVVVVVRRIWTKVR